METLTPEQAAQISLIVEKWIAIALSTEPIDRHKATSAINSAYALLGKEAPEIVFCPSPRDAFNKLFLSHLEGVVEKIEEQIVTELADKRGILDEMAKKFRKVFVDYSSKITCKFFEKIWINQSGIWNELSDVARDSYPRAINNVASQLHGRITSQICSQAQEQIKSKLTKLESQLGKEGCWPLVHLQSMWYSIIGQEKAGVLGYDCCEVDILVSVFNFKVNQSVWEGLESLAKECGHIYPYEKMCVVCDRPRIVSLDNQHRLHAEGAPAIEFADGFSFYFYHGVKLPEKYGKLHPQQWQAEWILEEKNAEWRRVLIQGIGYARICQELQATELDTWQEYTLLKIDKEVDDELIYLLKMTCPSTGHIHALRVPPDIESAREAIRWVNWGIDPEEFSVQT